MQADQLKILLIQIRENEQVILEEQESFARYAGLKQEQFKILNVFETPRFGLQYLSNIDAVIVGGASEASVLEPTKYPFVECLQEFLNLCLDRSTPVFASCFGFQAALKALGGELTKNTTDFEMGTYPMKLTQAAILDPIFKNLPDNFFAISVHQESAYGLPDKCELLASTEMCIHAFRVKGKPFWAFQFHPELNKKTLSERLKIYQEKYTDGHAHIDKILHNLQEVDHSNKLVTNFIEYLISGETKINS